MVSGLAMLDRCGSGATADPSRIAQQRRGGDAVILPGQRPADHQGVAHAARLAGDDAQVGLVVEQLVLLVAHQPARAGRQAEAGAASAGRAGDADRRRRGRWRATGWRPVVGRQKVPCGALVWLYWPTRCQRVRLRTDDVVAELVAEGRGQAVDRGLLLVEVAIAEIVAVVDLRRAGRRSSGCWK